MSGSLVFRVNCEAKSKLAHITVIIITPIRFDSRVRNRTRIEGKKKRRLFVQAVARMNEKEGRTAGGQTELGFDQKETFYPARTDINDKNLSREKTNTTTE
jgi:hypothetical protein